MPEARHYNTSWIIDGSLCKDDNLTSLRCNGLLSKDDTNCHCEELATKQSTSLKRLFLDCFAYARNDGNKRFFGFHPQNDIAKKAAFTLAEVLITLGIIGVVAAMTLPTLISNYKDQELVTRTKKAYSVIEQAALMAQQDLGQPGDMTSIFDPTKTSEEVTKNFSKYFNGAKYCEAGANAEGCENLHYTIKYASKLLKVTSSGDNNGGTNTGTTVGDSMARYPRIVLNDGTVIAIQQFSTYKQEQICQAYNQDGTPVLDKDGNQVTSDCSQYRWATIYFDVNGVQNPNQFGRDAFSVYVRDKIMPDPTWTQTGGESLRNILSGGKPIYSDYVLGQQFEW